MMQETAKFEVPAGCLEVQKTLGAMSALGEGRLCRGEALLQDERWGGSLVVCGAAAELHLVLARAPSSSSLQ